jgi:gluconate 2-dehydrogenase gamma chain
MSIIPVLNRRQALRCGAALFGAALVPPVAATIYYRTSPDGPARNEALSEAQRQTIAALSESIIPRTDTPGAIEAGVPDFIEMMLRDFYDEKYRSMFLEGLQALDAYAEKEHGRIFAALSEPEQAAIVEGADSGAVTLSRPLSFLFSWEEFDFFRQAKRLVIIGYYSSEVGLTQEYEYVPVPGRYDGHYPFEKVGTLFAG